MPETLFEVRWPDDSRDTCYSPSSIIAAHLEGDRTYTVATFTTACRTGLSAASERVRQVYGGLGCLRATSQLAAIQAKARRFGEAELVRVETVLVQQAEKRVDHGG